MIMERARPNHGFGTHAIHASELADPFGSHTTPLYQSSVFGFPDVETGQEIFAGRREGYVYTRWGNPTTRVLERRIAALEGLGSTESADAVAFGSGMGAISAAVLACLDPPGRICAQDGLYGGTTEWLHDVAPQLGIEVAWADGTRPETFTDRFRAHDDVRLVYLESPANPTLSLTDIAAVAAIAREHGARVVVDNTFATPFLQRPLALGADLVVHSTSKYLSGHGQVIGGIVVGHDRELVRTRVLTMRKYLGAVPGPFDSWLVLSGLKTLHVRMPRHCANARALAQCLERDRRVARVHYPGLASHPQHALAARQMADGGGMLAFELTGGYDAGVRFMSALRLATIAPSLGSPATLVQHPASMSHMGVARAEREKAGISDGLIRVSVGLEDAEDLLEDFRQALERMERG
jgi:methionine-gamma-lyase